MRVLFIHNQYQQAGGEDVAVETETRLLEERGHQVLKIVFSNTANKSISGRADAAWKAIYNPGSYRLIKKRIETFRPDIIHVHNLFFVASPSVLFAAHRLKIPVIMTVHNYRLICANALLLRNGKICELCVSKTLPLYGISYKCYRHSMAESALVTAITGIHKILGTWRQKINRYIVLTEFAKLKLANSSLQLQPNKFVVKPNFIPDPGEGKAERDSFFLFVGRLAKEKGIHFLLQAFSVVPGSRLIVIGEGPDKELLQQKFSTVANITFGGKKNKDEVLELMKLSKALIFPSVWYEGLPFTIIESFATGTPVISSKLGAMEELIRDGYNGYHFETGDVNDLRKKIDLFEQNNPEVRQRLYKNARKTYLDHFHPDIHYNAIMNIYKSVIAENTE